MTRAKSLLSVLSCSPCAARALARWMHVEASAVKRNATTSTLQRFAISTQGARCSGYPSHRSTYATLPARTVSSTSARHLDRPRRSWPVDDARRPDTLVEARLARARPADGDDDEPFGLGPRPSPRRRLPRRAAPRVRRGVWRASARAVSHDSPRAARCRLWPARRGTTFLGRRRRSRCRPDLPLRNGAPARPASLSTAAGAPVPSIFAIEMPSRRRGPAAGCDSCDCCASAAYAIWFVLWRCGRAVQRFSSCPHTSERLPLRVRTPGLRPRTVLDGAWQG